MIRAFLALPAALLLPGCAMMDAPTGSVSREAAIAGGSWRSVATPADRARLRDWWGAWQDGLRSARETGHGAEVAAAGALLQPMAALPGPTLPPGNYRCRILKVGTPGGGTLGFVDYPFFRCRVDGSGAVASFTKLTGSQRQVGLIFPDSGNRAIFLGTLSLGDETRAMDYGTDPSRDVAGVVERIGDNRWRIVFPRPAFESIVDVMELVPEG